MKLLFQIFDKIEMMMMMKNVRFEEPYIAI